jgi:ankyrin repeat protein
VYICLAAGSDLEASNVNSEGLDHFRALHFAAKGGCDDVVRALVEAGAQVDSSDRSKMTPLHRAIESGHESTASLLLELGADPLVMDCNQMDAFSWAAKAGLTSILMDMVERSKQRELNAR